MLKAAVRQGESVYDLTQKPPVLFKVTCNCPSSPVRRTARFINLHREQYCRPNDLDEFYHTPNE